MSPKPSTGLAISVTVPKVNNEAQKGLSTLSADEWQQSINTLRSNFFTLPFRIAKKIVDRIDQEALSTKKNSAVQEYKKKVNELKTLLGAVTPNIYFAHHLFQEDTTPKKKKAQTAYMQVNPFRSQSITLTVIETNSRILVVFLKKENIEVIEINFLESKAYHQCQAIAIHECIGRWKNSSIIINSQHKDWEELVCYIYAYQDIRNTLELAQEKKDTVLSCISILSHNGTALRIDESKIQEAKRKLSKGNAVLELLSEAHQEELTLKRAASSL